MEAMLGMATETGWICAGGAVLAITYLVLRAGHKVRRGKAIRRQLHLQMMRDARLCVKCGYDVRRTPERCPECGWPVRADP